MHHVVPVTTSTVEVGQFSYNSPTKRIEKVSTALNVETLPLSTIKEYVTVAYDGDCWLGCVTKVKMEEQSVEISFLHPKLPANSYVYP